MNDKNILYLDRKTASQASAGLLIILFLIFTIGYFTGKRHALHEIVQQSHQESFNDAITTALDSAYQAQNCTLYDPITQDQTFAQPDTIEIAQETSMIQDVNSSTPATRYYAELVGFGARRNAVAFSEKLNQRGIDVTIQERVSSSREGKKVTWFQILTPQFEHKEKLNDLISTIKKYETLHDIRIREIHA